jgi:hypothetical protein
VVFLFGVAGRDENPLVRQLNVRGTLRWTPMRNKRSGDPEPDAICSRMRGNTLYYCAIAG